MTISLRLSEEESTLFKKYAELNGISVSDLIRRSVLEHIEDECDLAAYEEAFAEYVKNGRKSRPIEELWKELGI